jgi:hypothetical protein
MGQPTCPECGAGPLVRGTFCRDCGWDGEVMDRADDAYLEGVDLPQGYGGDDDGFDYEAVLRREGLLGGGGGGGDDAPRRPPDVVNGAATVHLLVAGVVLAFVVIVALLSFR